MQAAEATAEELAAHQKDYERREAELEAFLAGVKGFEQRTPEWYGAMGTTVGGSELAAVLGRSPYASFYSVAANKVAIRRGRAPAWTGSVPCWWGTLFEEVVAEVVAADLGGRVRGDSVCIQAFPGHRNSPDGYLVVRQAPGQGGPVFWKGRSPPPRGLEAKTALLEIKCPLIRRPAGEIPRQYLPQLWSGLAVSPVADFGLYVDAVIRRCRIVALGGGPAFDGSFHSRCRPFAAGPFAWGALAVFAGPGGPPAGRGAEWPAAAPAEEAAAEAAAAEAAAAEAALERIGEAGGGWPVDFGGLAPGSFEEALRLIDGRALAVVRLPPAFHDGRGPNYEGREGEAWALAEAAARAPPGHRFLGLLPWKLFELHYHPAAAHPNFEKEILPRVGELHRLVEEALASPDPERFLEEKERLERGGGGAGAGADVWAEAAWAEAAWEAETAARAAEEAAAAARAEAEGARALAELGPRP
jgi:hypothetical protein